MKTILVIEDDPGLLRGLKDNLVLAGYEVITAHAGHLGVTRALQARPDGIILDLMLPDLNGFEVCRAVREAGLTAPVLMLSARSQDTDKIQGLALGADDYVTKPFNLLEVLARVRAMIRRSSQSPPMLDDCRFGDVEVDFRTMQARKGGRVVMLSGLEFEVLRYLVQRRGEVVSREQLLEHVWGYHEAPVTRSVDNVVARLRQKLEPALGKPRHILTVHGVGYRFVS
jgi:DNA-binding response OmpR family regulator